MQLQLEALRVFAEPHSTRASGLASWRRSVCGSFAIARGGFWRSEVEKWVADYLLVADSEGKLPKPFLTGEDLRNLGIAPGKEMGELLRKFLMRNLSTE